MREAQGSVTVPAGLRVEPHEFQTALRLSRLGYHVRFNRIDHTPGTKDPDVTIDGEPWELKSPKGGGRDTISNQFTHGRRQAKVLVIDLQRCGVPDAEALAQIKRRFFGQSRVIRGLVFDHQGMLTELPPADRMGPEAAASSPLQPKGSDRPAASLVHPLYLAAAQGSVTVPAGLRVEPHEFQTTLRLSRLGYHVRFNRIDHTPGTKDPDVTIDGEPWELKSPKGGGKSTISHQFARAGKQSANVVIDLARAELSDALALDQICRRFGGQQRVTRLLIIDKEGRVTEIAHSDKMTGEAAGSAPG